MKYNWDIGQIRKNKLLLIPLLCNPLISKEKRNVLEETWHNYNLLEKCFLKKISIYGENELDNDKYIDVDKLLPRDNYYDYCFISDEVKKIILDSKYVFANFEADRDIEYKFIDISNRKIVDFAKEFYDWIGNKMYIDMVSYITNPNNHFIRFIDGGNSTTFGNNLSLYYPKYNPYITVEKGFDIQDLCTLNHEIAHAIFYSFAYPIKEEETKFLFELEGHFFDYLCIKYLKIKGADQISQKLIYDRLENMFNMFHNILVTSLAIELFQSGQRIDFIKIYKNINQLGFERDLDNDILISSLNSNLKSSFTYLLSFLTSLDLEHIYESDPQYAFYLLEQIRLNQIDKVVDILRGNNITFMDDGYKNLRKEIEKVNSF